MVGPRRAASALVLTRVVQLGVAGYPVSGTVTSAAEGVFRMSPTGDRSSSGDDEAFREPSAPIEFPAAGPPAELDRLPEPSAEQSSDAPRRGRMSFQDPETTVPREPTLAERRARELEDRRKQEAEEAWWDEQQKQAKRRKRMLIGGGVGIGLVAVIALAYAASGDDKTTTARCVDQSTNVVVSDNNCTQPVANTTHYGGGGFYPIFIGNGGRQYHYTYGGSGTVGQVETGGTTVPPRTGSVRTSSGSTVNVGGSSSDSESRAGSSTVRRGGFGVSSSGESGGG